MGHKSYDFTLKELLILILRKSGIVILCALIAAGGASLFFYSSKGASERTYQSQLEKYIVIEREKQQVIEKTNNQLLNMNEYYSKSLLMQANPWSIRTAYLDFIIKENLIIPSVENEGSIYSSFFGVYQSVLDQAPLEALLGDLFPDNYDDSYIRETIEISLLSNNTINENDPVVRIAAFGNDHVNPLLIVERLFDYLVSKQSELTSLTNTHQLLPLGKIELVTQSKLIAAQQQSRLDEINTTTIRLKEQEDNLKKHQSSRPVNSNSKNKIIKNIVLAFAGGAVAAIAFIITAYMANNRIQTAYQIQEQLGIRYLGGGLYKKGRLMTRLADHLCGAASLASDPDIRALVTANILEATHGKENNILLTGTLSQPDIQSLSDALPFSDGLNVKVASDLPNNPSAIELLDQAQAVIIVERIGVSKLNDIGRTIERAQQSEKKVIGYTLI